MANQKHDITKEEIQILRHLHINRVFLDDFQIGLLDDRINAFKKYKSRTKISTKQAKIFADLINELHININLEE